MRSYADEEEEEGEDLQVKKKKKKKGRGRGVGWMVGKIMLKRKRICKWENDQNMKTICK